MGSSICDVGIPYAICSQNANRVLNLAWGLLGRRQAVPPHSRRLTESMHFVSSKITLETHRVR